MEKRAATVRDARIAVRVSVEDQREVEDAAKTRGYSSPTLAQVRSFERRFGTSCMVAKNWSGSRTASVAALNDCRTKTSTY